MSCPKDEKQGCNKPRGNTGYVFIIVLYILLAIIIGTVIY